MLIRLSEWWQFHPLFRRLVEDKYLLETLLCRDVLLGSGIAICGLNAKAKKMREQTGANPESYHCRAVEPTYKHLSLIFL